MKYCIEDYAVAKSSGVRGNKDVLPKRQRKSGLLATKQATPISKTWGGEPTCLNLAVLAGTAACPCLPMRFS